MASEESMLSKPCRARGASMSSPCCFFFSSRRRHTRFDCDWSSDVCSSDLQVPWQKVEAVLPERGQVWLRGFVANLPWEREKRLRALRADPVAVASLKILNT